MTTPIDIAALRERIKAHLASDRFDDFAPTAPGTTEVLALLDRLEAAEAVLRDADTRFGYLGFRSPCHVVMERYQTWQRLARGEG